MSPLQGSEFSIVPFQGRCPWLSHVAPLGQATARLNVNEFYFSWARFSCTSSKFVPVILWTEKVSSTSP